MILYRNQVISLLLLLLLGGSAFAGVLPEERSDILYHRYEGGGVEIDGPSVLVRKQVGKSVSMVANYYVDYVSSASIDVITTASPYTEERTQWSLGMDYLRGNTTMSFGYTSSVESDFDSETFAFSVSQDMFGDLTTLTLSYSYGDDVVGRSDDPSFAESAKRQSYGLGITQILSKNFIATLNVEVDTDEGYLNNPYRSVVYLDPNSQLGYSFEPELYPRTRTSNAVGLRGRYYLPWRAAVELEYRFFRDTWDIDSHMGAVSYIHPWGPWTFKGKYRYNGQNSASFYRNFFARPQQTNFRARDKELSELYSRTSEFQVSYKFIDENKGWNFIKKASVTFAYDHLNIKYPDFSDLTQNNRPYILDANVYRLFVSAWY